MFILLIILCGTLAYSNTFSVPFLFDDFPNIVENPLIQNFRLLVNPVPYCSGISPQAGEYAACSSIMTRYIGYLTFALNYRMGGLSVTGYHVVNLMIHLASALLVYLLVALTFQTPYYARFRGKGPFNPGASSLIALFVSLLFVSHPIQTQAVTYIVQRFASLATLFFLLSLVTYIKWRLSRQNTERSGQHKEYTTTRQLSFHAYRLILYTVSLLSAVLAMETKEIAFVLPIVVLLYEFTFFEGRISKRLLFLLPLVLTALIIPLQLTGIGKTFTEVVNGVGGKTRLLTIMSRGDYLFTEMRVMVTYIRLLFLPVGQNLDYDYPLYHSFLEPNVSLSFLFLSSLIAIGASLLYHTGPKGHGSSSSDPSFLNSLLRLTAFGILWFFITASIESGLIPIVDVIFEHRVYLPSVGAFIAMTTAAFTLAGRLKGRWPRSKQVVVSVLTLVVMVLSVASFARNRVWQDDVTLWQDVVSKSTQKARGYNNLGIAYMKRDELDKAIASYDKALEVNPGHAETYCSRGLIHARRGHYEHAIEDYTKAISLTPRFAKAYHNRGIAFTMVGLRDRAIEDFTRALTINPSYANAYFSRGLMYAQKGLFREGIADFSRAIALTPEDIRSYAGRGLAYLSLKERERALPDLRHACDGGSTTACDTLRRTAEEK